MASVYVIVDNEEAWQAADSLSPILTTETIARARRLSPGPTPLASKDGGPAQRATRWLEISPNLLGGVGLARGGAGTAGGRCRHRCERINSTPRWVSIALLSFSGYPHLEERTEVQESCCSPCDVAVPSIPQPQGCAWGKRSPTVIPA
ncbi:hypothetical protein MJ579_10555 [Klebsiella pneumoniae]|nr:hypothetical protein MJ579_10555 [Klebsiella pneumoniae]